MPAPVVCLAGGFEGGRALTPGISEPRAEHGGGLWRQSFIIGVREEKRAVG